ncbi:MAG: hypothetical protein AB3N18_03785 [Allomuricauda sp.]
MTNQEEHKIATSIWILSCNDKIPRMLFKSLPSRLGVQNLKAIKGIIEKFPELFRHEIQKKHLDKWKEEMHSGHSRPKWIANSSNQKADIAALKIEDTFLNRFRGSYGSPPVDHEILKWGLDYIDEYYSLSEKKKEKQYNRISTVVLPLFSVITAILAVFFSYRSNTSQLNLEFPKTKNELIIPSYHKFLNGMNKSLQTYGQSDMLAKAQNHISDSRTAIYELRPFLTDSIIILTNQKLEEYHVKLLKSSDNDSIPEIEISEVIQSYRDAQNIMIESVLTVLNKKEIN